jgi:hypothetical protein
MFYNGYKIVVSPLISPAPIVKILDTFTWCTDKKREEINSWFVKRFGTKEVCYMSQDTIFVGLKTMEKLKVATT